MLFSNWSLTWECPVRLPSQSWKIPSWLTTCRSRCKWIRENPIPYISNDSQDAGERQLVVRDVRNWFFSDPLLQLIERPWFVISLCCWGSDLCLMVSRICFSNGSSTWHTTCLISRSRRSSRYISRFGALFLLDWISNGDGVPFCTTLMSTWYRWWSPPFPWIFLLMQGFFWCKRFSGLQHLRWGSLFGYYCPHYVRVYVFVCSVSVVDSLISFAASVSHVDRHATHSTETESSSQRDPQGQ